MATTGGMHCTCSDTMAASCVLPPADAAGNWTQLLLLAALMYLVWHREDDSSDDESEDKPPAEMYN